MQEKMSDFVLADEVRSSTYLMLLTYLCKIIVINDLSKNKDTINFVHLLIEGGDKYLSKIKGFDFDRFYSYLQELFLNELLIQKKKNNN